MTTGVKIGAGLSCLLLIPLLCVWIYPPILAIGFGLMGRSPSCTIPQAFRGAQASLNYHEIEREYLGRKDLFILLDRDAAGYEHVRTPEGDYWISQGNERVLRVLVAQQKADIYGTGNLGVKRGDVVLDCGAHIGIFTRKALALGASRVIAIEPGPENLECLRRNLKQEIASGLVTVYPKGVSDQETTLTFHSFPGNSAADSFVANDGSVPSRTLEVEVTTIDKLTRDLGLRRVDFIKMDIKGSTEKALLGAKKTLLDFAPRLAVSTEETADNPVRVISLCQSLQPIYKRECGFCAIEKKLLLPMVVFFHP